MLINEGNGVGVCRLSLYRGSLIHMHGQVFSYWFCSSHVTKNSLLERNKNSMKGCLTIVNFCKLQLLLPFGNTSTPLSCKMMCKGCPHSSIEKPDCFIRSLHTSNEELTTPAETFSLKVQKNSKFSVFLFQKNRSKCSTGHVETCFKNTTFCLKLYFRS